MESTRYENIAVRIALSLREQAKEISDQSGVSLNHFITLALEEKMQRMERLQALQRSRTELASQEETRLRA